MQLNAYKAWVTFFTCRINTLKPPDTLRGAPKAIPGDWQCPWCNSISLQSLGDILRMQDKYTEASHTLRETPPPPAEIGNVVAAAECSDNLDKIMVSQSERSEVSASLAVCFTGKPSC